MVARPWATVEKFSRIPLYAFNLTQRRHSTFILDSVGPSNTSTIDTTVFFVKAISFYIAYTTLRLQLFKLTAGVVECSVGVNEGAARRRADLPVRPSMHGHRNER